MTAGERLRALAGVSGTAGALLLMIGTGATSGAILVDYSQLPTGTAAQHLLVDRVTTPPEEHHGGGWDYGEHKRKHKEKEELLKESRELITKIRTDDNPKELFAEAESVTSKIKKEIERLGLKAAYFERLHNEQQVAKALYEQEQLQAQMEEIDVVFMTFLMIAHLD
jgi:hypothetical protein